MTENTNESAPSTKDTPKKSGLNIFLLIASLSSIISVPLAIYYGINSRQYKQLSYYVTPNPPKVVDSSVRDQNIKVLLRDGTEIKQDLYVVQVTLWNSGSQPIKPEDIGSTIGFEYADKHQILSPTIVNSIHPEIANWDLVDKSGKKGIVYSSICPRWKIIDSDFAVKIQLLTTNNNPASLKAFGYVIGAGSLKKVDNARKSVSLFSFLARVLSFLTIVFLSVSIFSGEFKGRLRQYGHWNSWVIFILTFTLLMLCCASFILYDYFSQCTIPFI
jgi:hypothetical protein